MNTDDRFILSKGHGCLALYAVLGEIKNFCGYDSPFGGHPDSNKITGVEASTGSLGHGLPMAVGMALGSKIRKLDNRIFCLVGDGECNEGTIWESALLASHHKLSNLCCIVDYNHSTDRALKMSDIAAKFDAFGWYAVWIQGHNHREIEHALTYYRKDMPVAIIANTIKGHGVKRMENDPAWHHRAPTDQELAEILEELA